MTPSVSTPKDQAREDERVEKGKRAHHAHALELAAARMKADGRPASADSCLNAAAYLRAFPSPADPVRAALEASRKLVSALDGLIVDSEGVAGLHLNGDVAPWDELVSGGRFEIWLSSLDEARAALATLSNPPGRQGKGWADHRPQFEAADAEPSVRMAMEHYYRQVFSREEATALADRYVAALVHPPQEGGREGVDIPAGAIYNGRAHLEFLSSVYQFKDEHGHSLSLCSDYEGALRCFEVMAQFIFSLPAAPTPSPAVPGSGEGN